LGALPPHEVASATAATAATTTMKRLGLIDDGIEKPPCVLARKVVDHSG
jgi:hypothetical protein